MPIDNRHHSTSRRSIWIFLVLCGLVIAVVGGYGVYSRKKSRIATDADPAPVDVARAAEIRRRPHVIFRVTAQGSSYGHVGVVPLDTPDSTPAITALTCDRVYASSMNGLCLQASRGVFTTYRAIAFGANFDERHTFELAGAPSRTRVASTAPVAASTVFVSGDSYAGGAFSTRTTLYDLRSNSIVSDLENFSVVRDGATFKRQDFNFWGVTFRDDGDRFYATLGTSGTLLLVEGSIRDRGMTVIGADVECPMLSPDGTRLVYKKRVLEGGRLSWRLRVLDLQSRAGTDLGESRNVDDQAEWLDDKHVVYALPREGTGSSDIWAVPADGGGEPRLFIADAFSPAVVRAAQ